MGTIGCLYILANFIRLLLGGEDSHLTLSQLIDGHAIEYGWILKLMVNCFGYSCVFVPGILIYLYTKKIKYIESGRSEYIIKKHIWFLAGRHLLFVFSDIGIIPACVKFCLNGLDIDQRSNVGATVAIDLGGSSLKPSSSSTAQECILYAYCFFGLMATYLTWGLLQEKIITQQYENADGKKAFFRDSQFLVFTNRCLAFVIACGYLIVKPQQRHRAPMFKYSYASFSNIMSAWFQYEALKFVNFPTQVLAKSCKIIPVMLMGKVVSRSKYEFYEYLTAILISLGMVFFLMGSANGTSASSITTMTGVLLLTLYMTFDSFTSNWQSDLFRSYQMTSIQMMCGVNLFSTLFTAASLAIQGGFLESISFASEVRTIFFFSIF